MITPFVLDYNTITLYLSKITELLHHKYHICRLMRKHRLIPTDVRKSDVKKARNISGFAKVMVLCVKLRYSLPYCLLP